MTFKLYVASNHCARYIADAGMDKLAEVTLELPTDWSKDVTHAKDYSVEVRLWKQG